MRLAAKREPAPFDGLFQIVAIAVPALAIYTIISSVTDGAIKRPVNTYATVAGFAVCAIGSMMVSSSSPAALSVAYAVGQWVIGGYLLIVAFRELGARPPIGYIVSAAAVGVVLGLATAGTSVLPVPGMPGALLTLVVAGIATAGGLVGVLWFAPESLGYRSTLIQVATNIRTRSA